MRLTKIVTSPFWQYKSKKQVWALTKWHKKEAINKSLKWWNKNTAWRNILEYEQSNIYVITWQNKDRKWCSNWSFNAGFLSAIKNPSRIFFLRKYECTIDNTFQLNLWEAFSIKRFAGWFSSKIFVFLPTNFTVSFRCSFRFFL